MRNLRLNRIYHAMKVRCYYPSGSHYKDYGGRGITICDEWLDDEVVKYPAKKGWLAFEKWALENGYSDNLTIDRIDVNKGYSPDNCRWVSYKVQANNTRRNKKITYKGETKTLTEWCKTLNLDYKLIVSRLKNNWTIEKAFNVKENPRSKMIFYKGKRQSLVDWCKDLGLNYNKTKLRLNSCHWSVEKAFETTENPHLKMIEYKGRRQSLSEWCKELGLEYSKIKHRLNKGKWSVNKAFETK